MPQIGKLGVILEIWCPGYQQKPRKGKMRYLLIAPLHFLLIAFITRSHLEVLFLQSSPPSSGESVGKFPSHTQMLVWIQISF